MKANFKTFFLLTTCSILYFSACKNDAPKTTTPTTPAATTATAPPTPKPEIYLYQTVYEGMQMRAEPNMKGKVVTKFLVNDFLEGTGDKSKEQFEATLGGFTRSEPFYAATTTTPEQLKGWIYGGGIQTVYAGSRATSPDLGKLSQLGMYLAKLDIKKVSSGESAWQYVKANLADTNGSLADAVGIMLMCFQQRMDAEGKLYTATENMDMSENDWEKVDNGTYNMTTSKALKALDAAGFRLTSAEGSVFPIPDSRKFLDFFGKKGSPAMKNYYELSIVDEMRPYSKDAGLVIPLEELADRCVLWEQFNTANPYFAKSEETQNIEKWYVSSLISGQNNTAAFDFEAKVPDPDFTKAWAYVMQKYPNTKLGKTVAEFTKLLASEGNKDTEKVQKAREVLAN